MEYDNTCNKLKFVGILATLVEYLNKTLVLLYYDSVIIILKEGLNLKNNYIINSVLKYK